MVPSTAFLYSVSLTTDPYTDAENTMILAMLKLIGKQRHVQLTVGFVDTDNASNSTRSQTVI